MDEILRSRHILHGLAFAGKLNSLAHFMSASVDCSLSSYGESA